MTQKQIIVDSSVAVKWVSSENELHVEKADLLLKMIERSGAELIMPELGKYEVGNALLYKKNTTSSLDTLLNNFYHLPIRFIVEDRLSARRSAEIAKKYIISFYDASFIALAEKLNTILVTDNIRHQAKYKGKVKVIALKDIDTL